MTDRVNRLWPFTARAAVLAVPAILLASVVSLSVARTTLGWPTLATEQVVLIGIFVLSVPPLLLAFVDALFQGGAVIEFKWLKLNLAQVAPAAHSVAPVPTNIGVRAQAVNDSSSAQILASLEGAVNNEVISLDLEDGQAWWETRLLVLLAGATRLGRPHVVIFMGTLAGRNQQFLGWAYSRDLFNRLLHSDQRYIQAYYATKSAANQWELIEPPAPNMPAPNPPAVGLANRYFWMAFSGSGLVSEFAREQLFASELGGQIEEQPQAISAVRLQNLFGSILHMENIDQEASVEDQLQQFATGYGEYIGITRAGKFVQLARRTAILSMMVARPAASEN